MNLLLLFALLSPEYSWVNVKPTSYKIDRRYENSAGNVMGEYYKPFAPTHQPNPQPPVFTASCWDGRPTDFRSEPEAKAFVEACPKW